MPRSNLPSTGYLARTIIYRLLYEYFGDDSVSDYVDVDTRRRIIQTHSIGDTKLTCESVLYRRRYRVTVEEIE